MGQPIRLLLPLLSAGLLFASCDLNPQPDLPAGTGGEEVRDPDGSNIPDDSSTGGMTTGVPATGGANGAYGGLASDSGGDSALEGVAGATNEGGAAGMKRSGAAGSVTAGAGGTSGNSTSGVKNAGGVAHR